MLFCVSVFEPMGAQEMHSPWCLFRPHFAIRRCDMWFAEEEISCFANFSLLPGKWFMLAAVNIEVKLMLLK